MVGRVLALKRQTSIPIRCGAGPVSVRDTPGLRIDAHDPVPFNARDDVVRR